MYCCLIRRPRRSRMSSRSRSTSDTGAGSYRALLLWVVICSSQGAVAVCLSFRRVHSRDMLCQRRLWSWKSSVRDARSAFARASARDSRGAGPAGARLAATPDRSRYSPRASRDDRLGRFCSPGRAEWLHPSLGAEERQGGRHAGGHVGARREYRLVDIAAQPGLSRATVDRVLHGREGVRPETVTQVTRAIDELERQREQVHLSARTLIWTWWCRRRSVSPSPPGTHSRPSCGRCDRRCCGPVHT